MPQMPIEDFAPKRKSSLAFLRKAPQPLTKQDSRLSGLIANQRATVMEGSFGDHKTHYGTNRIKVKGEKNERLFVFFAVMTANAVKISKRKLLLNTVDPPFQQAA